MERLKIREWINRHQTVGIEMQDSQKSQAINKTYTYSQTTLFLKLN